MELDGKKHPRGDRLCPSPGWLEAPMSHRIDRCVVEIRVSGGDLDEDLAHATVGQDLDTQTCRTRERGAARNDHGSRGALRTGAGRGSSRGAGVRECSTSFVNRMGQLRAIHEWPDRRYTRPTWISAASPNARLHRRINSRTSTQVLPRA